MSRQRPTTMRVVGAWELPAFGTAVEVADNRDGGYSSDPGPWVATCHKHLSSTSRPSRPRAEEAAASPDEWCAGCRFRLSAVRFRKAGDKRYEIVIDGRTVGGVERTWLGTWCSYSPDCEVRRHEPTRRQAAFELCDALARRSEPSA